MSRGRYVRKMDSNQADIVAALRRIGCAVQDYSTVGGGHPDLGVSRNGANVYVECKSDPKISHRKGALEFTDEQIEWMARWKGPVVIAYSPEDAINKVLRLTPPRSMADVADAVDAEQRAVIERRNAAVDIGYIAPDVSHLTEEV